METTNDTIPKVIISEDADTMTTTADSSSSNSIQDGFVKKLYVLAVDVGSTVIRCQICDKKGNIKATASQKLQVLYPEPGHAELDEEVVWSQFTLVIRDAITAACISSEEIDSFGLAVQRGTFITWDRITGESYHPFITWQDTRAVGLVNDINSSYLFKGGKSIAKLLYILTRKPRFQTMSMAKFRISHVTVRLAYILDAIPNLRRNATDGRVMFGTLDTWLLWKLTGGQLHVTEYSCASATGLFDPHIMKWNTIVFNMLHIPKNMMPKICDTSGLIAHISPDLFGAVIPITTVIGDQSAAMFGHGCYEPGDVKVTLGTGTYLDINMGSKTPAMTRGLSPIVAWKIQDEVVYCLEGASVDTANVIDWALRLGLFDHVTDTASIAQSVEDSGGVYFVPAFSGLQNSAVNNDTACSSLFGITLSTTKAHVLRAVLESIVYMYKLLYETALSETTIKFNQIRVDGGVSNNDFIVQLMSDLTNRTLYRSEETEMTIRGAIYLAGLGNGFWQNREEIDSLKKSEQLFSPKQTWCKYRPMVSQWERALKRSMNWYKFSPNQKS